MAVVAVHPGLRELVTEKLPSRLAATLVDRAPADIGIDFATAATSYVIGGDLVMLAASNPALRALALEAAPHHGARLRSTATEVDAPLAQAVADSGGLGLAVVGFDLDDDHVRAGALALIALVAEVAAGI